MPYSTKQHQAVLRCLEARGETACTAAELAEDLRREGCPVGLATIYRQLEKLEAAGAVHKVNTEEGALYQYCGRQSQGHRDCFLLKCERCGRIRHVDCTQLQAPAVSLELRACPEYTWVQSASVLALRSSV